VTRPVAPLLAKRVPRAGFESQLRFRGLFRDDVQPAAIREHGCEARSDKQRAGSQ